MVNTYNFTELKTRVAKLVQKSDDTTYMEEIGVWLNLGLKYLHDIYDYWPELKATHNFTTVDGTALYYMPSDFGKPMRWYDITHDKKIIIKTEEEYFDGHIADIADANEADADTAYFKESVGVKRQVSTSGDTVKVKSSSSSDTSIKVRVEGYLDSDLLILGFEEITVTGTSYVAGTVTFYKLTHVSKQGDSVGYITLADSTSNVLSILQSIDRVIFHQGWRLGKIPDDSTTNMRVLYKKVFRRLVNDYDYPFLDADNFLIFFAVELSLQQSKETIDRAVVMQKEAEKALSGLMLNYHSKYGPDYQHKIYPSIYSAHRQ